MRATYDVVGIGNAISDIIAPVEAEFLVRLDMPPNATNLVDEGRARRIEAALDPDTILRTPGGAGANTLVGAARLGARGGYMFKVADDETGRIYTRSLEAEGLATVSAEPLRNGPSSARSIIVVTPDGERTMNTYLGASVMFDRTDIDDEMIRSADTIYLEGYLFDAPAAKAAFEHAAGVAQSAGRTVALTLSDGFCVDRHRGGFQRLVEGPVDIVFANEAEALALYEVDELHEVAAKLEAAETLAFITRGARGALVVDGASRHEVAALPIARVVDTTGAGDQFAAGVLAGLAQGLGPERAATLGCVAAHEVIGHFGPRPEADVRALAQGLLD